MALRSAWMVAWLMVSLNTHTLGPNAATFAPGHIDGSCVAGRCGAAGLASAVGATANPAQTASAASSTAGRLCGRTMAWRMKTSFLIATPFLFTSVTYFGHYAQYVTNVIHGFLEKGDRVLT